MNDAPDSSDRADSDGGGSSDGGRADSSVDETGTACVTQVPCSSDVQCAAVAGTGCNTALVPPTCQSLYCGTAGDACDTPRFCGEGMHCVTSDQGIPKTCRKELLTPAECVSNCLSAKVIDEGCTDYPKVLQEGCRRLCEVRASFCNANGGLVGVYELGCSFAGAFTVSAECADGSFGGWHTVYTR